MQNRSNNVSRRSDSSQPAQSGDRQLRYCRRCLLSEMAGQETLYQSVQRLRAAMPERERASDAEYEARLAVCRECPSLDHASCMQCGCYAEVRALKRAVHCPVKKW